jgi:hypothetical protein
MKKNPTTDQKSSEEMGKMLPSSGKVLDFIHEAVTKKEFGTVLGVLKPIKRKSEFWELAEKFHKRYGYNFRYEIRKGGSDEENELLSEFEYRIYKM